MLDRLDLPIVQAPMAGGPTTPQLAAAVSNAGGLGFLAAGYLTAAGMRDQISQAAALTRAPLGVNVFVPGSPSPPGPVAEYAATLAGEAIEAAVELGEASFDDDDWNAKLATLTADPLPVISFTFGCPDRAVIADLQGAGSEVWVTVTSPDEARQAADVGASALVVQGSEAGAHRGSFTDDPAEDLFTGFGLLSLLQLVRSQTDLPVIAAGGISTGAAVAAVLAGGAAAAQVGTAFLRCPEAGTAPVHRQAVAGPGQTAMTRAFSGRLARGIRNQFLDAHSAAAPSAYPEVNRLTTPLRAAGRREGNAELVNLWAGQTHELSRELPAGELVAILAREAREALAAASARTR